MSSHIQNQHGPVQDGLRRRITKRLQTLWIEIFGDCNLKCPYCFARGKKVCAKNMLLRHEIGDLLDQAKRMGVDSIGVPGIGEPFFGRNVDMTMWFLRECAARGFYVTLFTTGQFITRPLAAELFQLPVEIMVKGNSLDPAMQDAFVSPKEGKQIRGYGAARNRAIDVLMDAGFADMARCMADYGRESRMALVTSIMKGGEGEPTNYDEMKDILKFCRDRNIIFDCDTVLERERGAECGMCITGDEIRAKQLELQAYDAKEYGQIWEPSQSYLGPVPCDRYGHHLYIEYRGDIRPCVGANGIKLGNIRHTTLKQAWNSPEMSIIRNRKYGGTCGTNCLNFKERKCNSCLGRRAIDLTNTSLLEKGFVDTIGCWNNRPIREEG